MSRRFILIVFQFAFCLPFGLLAQDHGTETIVYSKVEYDREKRDRGFNNAVKLNPLLIFVGDIPIYWEYRLSENTSFEVGVGITHANYFRELYYYDGLEGNRQPQLGYSFLASYKFYPSKYYGALEEWYFGPEFRMRRYNSEVEQCDSSTLPVATKSESTEMISGKIIGGYMTYFTENLFFDIYGGIGLSSIKQERYICDYSAVTSGYELTPDPNNGKKVMPVFSIGAKVGYAF